MSIPFNHALVHMKQGKKVARLSWHQKCYIFIQKGYPKGTPSNKQTADAVGIKEGDLFICNPYIQKANEDGSFSMASLSSDDILAEDWFVYSVQRAAYGAGRLFQRGE